MVDLAPDAAVILLTTGAIWVGSGWLEGAAEELSTYYGLPQVVQGSVVTAVGSSFPELATVVFAALGGSLDLGVGTIVGSAIFNILVIPGLAGISTDQNVEANRALVYKEAQFYMLSVAVLVITFAFGVIYYPADGSVLVGEITRPLAAVPLALYVLYLFIQYQDTAEYETAAAGDETVALRRQWLVLLAGLAVILVAVERLVHSVEVIGGALGVPAAVMGATIAAGATSLPDALVSVRAARDDRGVAAVANVLGSNTFDLLVAIPAGVLIAGSLSIDFAAAVPLFGALTLATVMLFTVLRTGLVLSRAEAYLLLLAYLVFVGWIVAETVTRIVDLLPN